MKVPDHGRRSGGVRARSLAAVACCVVILVGTPAFLAHYDPVVRIAELSRRIAADPENGALYAARGRLHRLEGDATAAAADFSAALALDPGDDSTLLGLAASVFESGRPHEAAGMLDAYLARHPNDLPARSTRARIRAALADPAGAVEDWRVAIPLARFSESDAPEHYIELARSLVDCGRAADAVEALDDGSVRLGRPVALELRALEIEVDLFRFDDAVARVHRLERSATRPERWTARRAEILEQAGSYGQALKAYRQALVTVETLPASRRATARDLESRIRDSLERLSAAVATGEREVVTIGRGS